MHPTAEDFDKTGPQRPVDAIDLEVQPGTGRGAQRPDKHRGARRHVGDTAADRAAIEGHHRRRVDLVSQQPLAVAEQQPAPPRKSLTSPL